ncbi:hypothetical protein MUN81_22210 (plasmid) [Hymenobacter sp. 5317J-9]|uniref:hypothetical protein n=1 Tax=Hymenobacter sp. 5317J-9 TaxID=2932250 RepID=UPI001FD6DF1E|nr:hypothetical protein [Hymenobacter sp. 5317J-9]UOR00183.1 hypothetical protein MUN81_22210 [Hymenobacter sp. 5317J-9]
MSFRLIKAVAATENADELHLARLLLLLGQSDQRSGSTMAGIMKLAKLDFLLRYPNCLERLLKFKNKNATKANIQPHERTSIESKMVRFRYGPWDTRYRRWIGLLVAKGLVVSYVKGHTVHIDLTDAGRRVVATLSESPAFADMQERSSLIYRTVGSMPATALKNLIYEVFPEIIDMKWGENIAL